MDVAPEFFTDEDFVILERYSGLKKDSENKDHQHAYNYLKIVYQKVEFWAKQVQLLTFPKGKISIIKRPTNQANHFDAYLWAKIYPEKDSPVQLAFTLEINASGDLIIKIDTVGLGDADEKRLSYLDYRQDWAHSSIVRRIHKKEVLSSGWMELFNLSSEWIRSWIPDYSLLLQKMGLRSSTPESTEDEIIGDEDQASKVAVISNDSDQGEDYLGISKDISAFAKTISSVNFKPPVAIALFGDWGTGKSFFMNKMKEKITALSGNGNPDYCQGIVQIHFNAWSYLDANLWASLVTQIFEKLNDYIKNDKAEPEIKKEIEKKLISDLTISREQQDYLKRQKKENETKLGELRHAKKSLKGELKEKIESVKKNTFVNVLKKVDSEFNVREKISSALDNNHALIETVNEIKKIVPEDYRENPLALYHEVNSKATFIREFFRKDKIRNNVIWMTCILLCILLVPPLVQATASWARHVNFQIPQLLSFALVILVPVVKRIATTYKELQPIISAFWSIKEDYEKNIENAISEFEQKEKAARLEIEQKEKELEFIESSIQEAKKAISILEFKINSTLSTEALYTFIDRRTNSDDYKKHLGIISFIRKDFEILSRLFIEHTREKELLEFREILKKPLERIVLYIDDLDRCPEEQVVQVLEAVNLLMAFPLFVVVVGVDPRWVRNALMKKYYFQFGNHLNESADDLVKIDSSNYLEKIFQVPFHLKVASDESIREMIGKLGRSNPGKEGRGVQGAEPGDLPSSISDPGKDINKTAELPEREEQLVLSEEEIALMQELSGVIGNNPRAVKRFVNVYKIIKAHEEFTPIAPDTNKEYMILMLLLAVPIGPFSKLTAHIYSFITYDPAIPFRQFFKEYKTSLVKNQHLSIDIVDAMHDLHGIVGSYRNGELLDISSGYMGKHYHLVKRFTFANTLLD